jgi:hypothetical protein
VDERTAVLEPFFMFLVVPPSVAIGSSLDLSPQL